MTGTTKFHAHRGTDKGHSQLIHAPVLRGQRRLSPDKVRFNKQVELDLEIVKVRKLLRTNLSVSAIAEELGVHIETLKRFLKRRNLCDLKERQRFIAYQRLGGPIEKHRKGDL